MKKKTLGLLSFLLSFLMIFSVSAFDTQDDSFIMETVEAALKNNMLETHRSYIFANPITREEYCELIYNLIYESLDDVELPDIDIEFTDTTNHKVIDLAKLEIIYGKSETNFSPQDNLTREEAAVIIGRTVDSVLSLPRHEMYFIFDDEGEISDWAKNSIQTVCNMGVMKGTGDNKFSPKGTLSVKDAITMLLRIFDAYKANESIEQPMTMSNVSFADKMNTLMPDDKNYMFSPLSIKMALATAANGAEGITRSEILNALGISDLDSYNQSVKEMIAKYSQSELLKLNVANSIWINQDKTTQRFSQAYKTRLSDYFGATSDVVNNNDASKKINAWVNDKTQGKIPSIISEDNADFWAMLVNAVYFKARWQNEFSEAATKDDIFFSKDGTQKSIDFMNRCGWMPYANADGVHIVCLPYLTRESVFDENGNFVETRFLNDVDVSMYLMMSESNFNAEETLVNADFGKSSYIALSVPKFEIEYDTEISDILKLIGIRKAFQNTAEFQNMFDHGSMQIDRIKHKTYIKVDEKGTEAAAVTSIGMAGSALPPEPMILKYNKPFTFVIRDNKCGEILFIGEYAFCQ